MNITKIAIENNRVTLVLLAIVVLLGIQTYNTMPRAYDPGFIIRAAQVVTYFPGASPERVENLVSAQIEKVVKEIPELDFVASESRTGISIVTVNIKESYTNMRPIWDALRRKIEDVTGDLPEGIRGPFVNDEFGDVYGIVLTLTGEGFDYAYLSDVADEVRDKLQSLPEAAKVDILGEQEEQIIVQYNNSRLAELGVSPSQVLSTLQQRNIVISGGAFNLENERIALEPSGNYESLRDIEYTILQVPGSERLLYLKDLAQIQRSYISPPSTVVHSSGERALAIAISMREGGNNILLGEQVLEAIESFNERYPWGLEFDLVNYSPAEVDKKVDDFVSSLIQAIVIVTAVMLLTLGLRTGLVVASLIPISMLMATIVMSLFNIGFDQISLAALIIALGMLVDNGIVMSENIMVQMEKGDSALKASIDSAQELRMPLLVASITTAAAFLPIYLAESNVGEFTASLFKVVSITLLCSWIISITFIPLLCVMFLRVKVAEHNYSGRFYSAYRSLLHVCLKTKWAVVLITAAIFFVSMYGFKFVEKVFFPPSDRTYFKVEVTMPEGTAIETTASVVERIEGYLADGIDADVQGNEGVASWVSYIGSAGPRFILSHNPKPSSDAYALMIVNVNALEDIPNFMQAINRFALNSFPDADVSLRMIESGPAVANPVEVRLSGNDELLFSVSRQLKEEMSSMPGLINISDNWGQRIKKLNVEINQTRALKAGVSSEDIAISLQTGLDGLELTEYRENEDIIPVLLRSSVANENNINKVESLAVYSQSVGDSVPLKQVADVNVSWDNAKIYRRNGERTITVGAQLAPGTNAAEMFSALQPWLEAQKPSWDQKIRYEFGGENESSGKANQSIADKLPLAVMIILILLVAQFNSLRKAGIILATIPLALIGVVVGLLIGQSFFGFMTLLGIISLAGIVINNAIVLLERIRIERDEGKPAHDAVVSAAIQRARPILLTTATTVLGLLPLYLGGGEMWEPMAIAIMAGLLFSTMLTLLIVPVLYAIFFRVDTSESRASE
jgi:multidrug efflux pump